MGTVPTEVVIAELKIFAFLPLNRDDLSPYDVNRIIDVLVTLYEAGQKEGVEEGYEEGYTTGNVNGYDAGFADGRVSALDHVIIELAEQVKDAE